MAVMSHTNFSRRRFLVSSAALGAGAALNITGCSRTPQVANSRVIGANDEIRVAVIGFRGRGADHLKEAQRNANVRIVALCDVDTNIIAREAKKFEAKGQKVDTYTDMRQVFDRKDIDCIMTATPNHWHALTTIWACQAGKDVYVEKPVCHNIWEGQKMIEAAAKYKRIVQAGTQRRSDKGFYELVDYLRSGAVGKILYAKGLCYKDRTGIGKVSGPQPIPAGVDYDLWCGPAPMDPLMRKNLHYDWHWVWPTGNGDVGNQGIHEVDQCRWILGYDKLAPRVYSFGGRYVWDDDGQTPNTHLSIWEYPIPILHEVRNNKRKAGDTAMDNVKGVRIGIYIHCEGGYYAGGENGGWVCDHKDNKIKQFVQDGSGRHTDNFFAAMRSRKTSDLHAPIQEGWVSSSLCHQTNISYRVGKQLPPGQLAERLKSDKLASDSWENMKAHLLAHNVDLETYRPTLGATLAFDPEAVRFTGPLADQANQYLSRKYRKPFVVPEKV